MGFATFMSLCSRAHLTHAVGLLAVVPADSANLQPSLSTLRHH